MLGQHADGRLELRHFEHPVQRRQLRPDFARLLRRVAELHGRAGKAKLGGQHLESLGAPTSAGPGPAPSNSSGSSAASGVSR